MELKISTNKFCGYSNLKLHNKQNIVLIYRLV